MYDSPTTVPSQLLSPLTQHGGGSGPALASGRRLESARLRAVIEHAFDGLWLLAADGIIRHASGGGALMNGSTAHHESRPSSDLLHPDDVAEWHALLAEVAGGAGRQRTADFRLSRGDGTWQRAEARVRNLLGHPDVAALVVDWRCIEQCSALVPAPAPASERHAAQRAADLAAVNRELEAFSYSVSHDLRAPLRCIDGFSRILLEDCRAELDDRGLYCLERIHAGAQRMNELIDSLLDLSGVTRVPMSRQLVDLSALATAIAGELHERAPQRTVQLTIAPGVTGDGDPRLLRILLENLLGNAWKYTARHPTAHIEFGVVREDGRPVYYVRDDGAGFDMCHAQRLFGAFQRLHASEEFDGTGIGLATVQRIVHRHGGRVWGEGAVDHGATFRFTLGA